MDRWMNKYNQVPRPLTAIPKAQIQHWSLLVHKGAPADALIIVLSLHNNVGRRSQDWKTMNSVLPEEFKEAFFSPSHYA